MRLPAVATLGLLSLGYAVPAMGAGPFPLTADAIDKAGFTVLPESASRRAVPEVVKAEVWLARAGFSPGAIDGIDGDNFRKALAAYQTSGGLPRSGRLDAATWARLSSDPAAVLQSYEVTGKDARGPFTRRIPTGFEAQSKLARLGYRDLKEELAERFHTTVPLLLALDHGRRIAAGARIDVPAATRAMPPEKAARVVVDKSGRDVEAFAADGRLLAFYPASIGSTEKPAPSGRFEVRRVVHHPDYTYDPDYHFKGVKARRPFTIAPGPNNPVGSVWLDLSDEGYGIHGTPDPTRIGKTESHGCIRLTNWDAENLATLVTPGTPVEFQDGPAPSGGQGDVAGTIAPAR